MNPTSKASSKRKLDVSRATAGPAPPPPTPLEQYLASLPRGGRCSMAHRLHVTRVHLAQLAEGRDGREASPALSVLIERESGGAVMRWHSRPRDWHQLWPELLCHPQAPKAPPDAWPGWPKDTNARGCHVCMMHTDGPHHTPRAGDNPISAEERATE